jgi:hypothetical protein
MFGVSSSWQGKAGNMGNTTVLKADRDTDDALNWRSVEEGVSKKGVLGSIIFNIARGAEYQGHDETSLDDHSGAVDSLVHQKLKSRAPCNAYVFIADGPFKKIIKELKLRVKDWA